jgi:TolB-like protein
MSLFSELKRRNVFKVAIAFLMLSWLVLQLVDVVSPLLFLPDWIGRGILLVLVALFPVTLIMTWAFELTADGVKKTEDVDADESIRANSGQKINYAIIGFLVLVIGFQFWQNSAEPDSDRERTIAVMPFADMSPDGSQEYFGDGIAEEILNVLVKIDELDVTSRTSSFALRDKNLLVPDIAAELNVNYIVEGSIRTAGNNVRVTAQLIEVDSDNHLWSDIYDRELTDIFAIQSEISLAITEALRIELVGGEITREAPTENMEAYDYYLQGRKIFLSRNNRRDSIATIELFERAVALDPAFAEGWANLAAVNALVSGVSENEELSRKRSREAVYRAISIDPNQSQAWAARGVTEAQNNDLLYSELSFLRAIELDPNNETAWSWLGGHYRQVGNFVKSIEAYERAIELEPTTILNYWFLRGSMISNGDYEKAEIVTQLIEDKFDIGERTSTSILSVAIINNDLETAREIVARALSNRTQLTEQQILIRADLYVNAYFDPSFRAEARTILEQDIHNGIDLGSDVFPYVAVQDGELYTANNRAVRTRQLFLPYARTMLN